MDEQIKSLEDTDSWMKEESPREVKEKRLDTQEKVPRGSIGSRGWAVGSYHFCLGGDSVFPPLVPSWDSQPRVTSPVPVSETHICAKAQAQSCLSRQCSVILGELIPKLVLSFSSFVKAFFKLYKYYLIIYWKLRKSLREENYIFTIQSTHTHSHTHMQTQSWQ